MYPAQEVADGLWVGSMADITDRMFLRRRAIRLVVNCTDNIPSTFFDPTLTVAIQDSADSREALTEALPWIVPKVLERRRLGHPVLIHCMAGVSRSATVAAAVLMAERRLTAAEAIAAIQERKPETFGTKGPDGNPVFWPVLVRWQLTLEDKNHLSAPLA
jgi:Dual specificity phosphatase, catalytic domain